MRSKFKVGDRVIPVFKDLKTFGYTGIVSEIKWAGDVVVKFDHLRFSVVFMPSSLRLANPPKKSDEEGVWLLVYNSVDTLSREEQNIFMGDVNSTETKKAIALAMDGSGVVVSACLNQDEVDDELNDQASMWCYVYGFINEKPFRISKIPRIEDDNGERNLQIAFSNGTTVIAE